MRIFLIRHGETVDNVAQVYAGSSDSELTNHGFQQATRLGQHLNALGLKFTHLFSSHLQRAFKTADLIREAQLPRTTTDNAISVPEVRRLPVLTEQDFGFYEGKKWYERPAGSTASGRDTHRSAHGDTPGFVDVETKESMGTRADTFLDEHLLPLFDVPGQIIAIISHGIFLSVLWRRFLARLPQKSVTIHPDLLGGTRIPSLEHLGGWSNTGYLELLLQNNQSTAITAQASLVPPAASASPTPHTLLPVASPALDAAASKPDHQAPGIDAAIPQPSVNPPATPVVKLVNGWTIVVMAINGKDHLKALKRTRGGVGSARHDEKQKSIDTFFKRRRVA